MDRKHYRAIASIINKAYDDSIDHSYDTQGIKDIIQGLSDFFASDNPRFDKTKFFNTCIPVYHHNQ
jgi:hypothetical protein